MDQSRQHFERGDALLLVERLPHACAGARGLQKRQVQLHGASPPPLRYDAGERRRRPVHAASQKQSRYSQWGGETGRSFWAGTRPSTQPEQNVGCRQEEREAVEAGPGDELVSGPARTVLQKDGPDA